MCRHRAPKRTPFFALIIGINLYRNIHGLKGAVTDADDMNIYLQNNLGVPEDQIVNLRDEEATRKNIINEFLNLQKNGDIQLNDAILIFYAGHGCELDPSPGWETGGQKMQGIVPHDIGVGQTTGQTTHPIPDRVIGALLDGLAREKGDNITVILDCCHAFSGTRDPVRIQRRADIKGQLPAKLDKKILSQVPKNAVYGSPMDITLTTQSGFLRPDLSTHVLLAACKDQESAWESHGRGDFTAALLRILRRPGANKLTYVDLINELPILPSQNPQCEGYNQKRILFNSRTPRVDHSFISIEQCGGTYKLKAGSALGVIEKSEFTVHACDIFDHMSNPPLCTLRVTSTSASHATLKPVDNATPYAIPSPAYARQVRSGPAQELHVHFTDALKLVVSIDGIRRAALDANEADIGFTVTEAETADYVVDLLITAKGQRAVFSTTNILANQYGVKKLPHHVPATAKELAYVLRGVAHWNWHFNRANPGPLSEKVHLNFYRLQVSGYDEDGISILQSDGDNMNTTGVVEITPNKDIFGVKILNTTKRDLYPYLFYFDVRDQSITPRNIGSIGTGQVPLPAGSALPIGYGASGDAPFSFNLQKDEIKDVGFLKVFLTTSPTDFGSLKLKSPFSDARGLIPPSESMARIKKLELWTAVMITIVQSCSGNRT